MTTRTAAKALEELDRASIAAAHNGAYMPFLHLAITFLAEHAATLRAALAQPQEEEVDDLAILVRRLAHKVKNLSPDSSLADKAMDYLRRIGKDGDILRATQSNGTGLAEPNDDR